MTRSCKKTVKILSVILAASMTAGYMQITVPDIPTSVVQADSVFRTYNLTDTEIRKIAAVCQHEQPGNKGAAAEASLMANKYEINSSGKSSLTEYVRNIKWWANSETVMDNYNSSQYKASESVVNAVRSVLVEGKRILPAYVDEHDYIGDIAKVTNDGVTIDKSDPSQYISHKSIIHQSPASFGSNAGTWIYYSHPAPGCDPFGYLSEARRQSLGEAYYSFETGELINGLPVYKNDEELDIPYPRPAGSPVLKKGSGGSGVSWLQSALNKVGYSLTVNGVFDSETEGAVWDFQTWSGIEVDGKVGSQTIAKLVEEVKYRMKPPEPEIPEGHQMSAEEGAGRTIPDGDYWMSSAYRPDYWVDIPGDEISFPGANVLMWIRDDQVLPGKFDVFTFKYLENGYYEIRQKDSDLCLDVTDASLKRGTNVQLAGANGSAAQQWSVIRTDTGYKLQSKRNSYILDISEGVYAKKQNLWTWEDNNGIWQRFALIPYSPSIGQTVPDGVYRIKFAKNPDYCLDASGNAEKGNYKDKTNIQLWGPDGDDLFRIEYNEGGYYIITELSTGLALCVDYPDPLKYAHVNTNIQIYQNHGKRSERWMIRKNSDSTYTFISQLSGYCLDVYQAKCEDGRNIETFCDNGASAQKWILEPEIPDGLAVESLPDKKVYLQNEKIDMTGFRALVKYSYGTFIDVTDSVEVKYDFTRSGTSEVKVSYVLDGVKYTESFNVKVVSSVEGDCNNDGKFNSADALTLKAYLLNKKDEEHIMANRLAADINGDGLINIADLCLMKEMILNPV